MREKQILYLRALSNIFYSHSGWKQCDKFVLVTRLMRVYIDCARFSTYYKTLQWQMSNIFGSYQFMVTINLASN